MDHRSCLCKLPQSGHHISRNPEDQIACDCPASSFPIIRHIVASSRPVFPKVIYIDPQGSTTTSKGSTSSKNLYFDLCVSDSVEQKVCYFRVVSARKMTVRLLNVPPQTVSNTICRFKELGNDGRRPGSGKKRNCKHSRNRESIEKRIRGFL
ncbi:hypothetical protein TNCV_1108031 [Trichonephila clavipes]|nr:hypothetical protein TNCV_1108031 [Trichonephila clavipes]